MAHDIFISYSTANQAWAESALQLLESQGFSCWMAPRDIRPGSTWAAEIVHGISNARVMLLLLSSASNQSRQVAREVQLADSSQLRILPVLLEAVKPEGDFVYFLSNTQWITALGGSAADHSATLLAAVGETLKSAAPREAQSSPAPQQYLDTSQYRLPPATKPLTAHPLFWLLVIVGVLLLAGIGYLIVRSPGPPKEVRQEPAITNPQAPNPALAGTWKGEVGTTNAITIQIQLQPGDRVVVLVDNQAAKTEREPAQVIEVSGGFIEMNMGQPPRARCKLRLSSDRRNLEGTWAQTKTGKTFNVVFTKAD